MILEEILTALRNNHHLFTKHALEKLTKSKIKIREVMRAVLHAEMIEDYPMAYPYPACLVLGFLNNGDPVHFVWAFNRQKGYAILVTAYRVAPTLWSPDFRKRVK